jgi:predicted Zn-dependent protease
MTIIQMNYEDSLSSALFYMSKLHGKYPKNMYYQGLLATILLHLHMYEEVTRLVDSIHLQKDSYSEMIRTMAEAYLAEHSVQNESLAKEAYLKTVALADSFGPIANLFKAIGYMGLSRIYEKEGLESDSKRYARRASNHTAYKFILDR